MTSSLTFRSRICEFFSSPSLSPFSFSPFSFLETITALKNALGKKEKERRQWMKNRQKNRTKTFPLQFKEKGAAVGEGVPIGRDETAERKTLSLSHLMQMGRTLTDETRLARWNDA